MGADLSVFLRLFPRVYAVPTLDGAIALPTQSGSGLVPSRLRAASMAAGDGRLLASLDLLFPIVNGLGWRAFNLLALRSVFSCLYFEGESLLSGRSLGLPDLHAGIELGILLTTLAGQTLPLALGLDFPITSIIQSEGGFWASLFISAHLPTLIYGSVLAY